MDARAFRLGVLIGAAGFVVAALTGTGNRTVRTNTAGVALASATWLAARAAFGSNLAATSVAISLLLLVLGGGIAAEIIERFPRARSLWVVAGAMAPGAILLGAAAPLVGSTTARVGCAIATIAIGVAVFEFESLAFEGATWLLFAATSAGVYLAVPDTELARVLIGVAMPFALLVVTSPACPLGPPGSAALAGTVTWVVFVGGRARPGSVVGGLATIGMLVALPVGRRALLQVTRRMHTPAPEPRYREWTVGVLVIVTHLVVVLYASRVVATQETVLRALLVLAPVEVVVISVAVLLRPHTRAELP